ncbi:MAG: hypothetical protein WCD18_25775, partial [Thermosynechococcaceae cyanobacterium]
SQSCTLSLNTTSAQITSTPTNCLPTGTRDLSKIGMAVLSSNQSGVLVGTANLGSPATLQFSYKGTLSVTSGTGVITVYPSSNATTLNTRCLVISSGIGIIRAGKYVGTSRSNPTDSANCNTSS